MRVVVADATPLNYLILVEAVEVLPRIFKKIHIPTAVRDELTSSATPAPVRAWIQGAPQWLEVLAVAESLLGDESLQGLGLGERAAIALAEDLRADLLLMDDRAGARIAQGRGFVVTGTLGILDLASRAGLIELRDVFSRLQRTNFRYPPSLLEKLLDEEKSRKEKESL